MRKLRGRNAVITGAAPGVGPGMAPEAVSRGVPRALRDGRFHIFTHPETRPVIAARHTRPMAAHEWSERVAPEIDTGDAE